MTSPVARKEFPDLARLAPDVDAALRALGSKAAEFGLDQGLLELVKIRASQINGCAFCLQFHIMRAESLSVPADKINLLAAWHDAPIFTARERAALAWTEALTRLPQGVSDDLYAEVTREFSDRELAYLSSAIAGINAWNRFGVAFRWSPPQRAATRRSSAEAAS